ncbi:MAG: low molecular weight protein-tyrosine phosphatase [Microbacteriaceae bacterium]|nr:low molecular weight protein-tyrosine phosphatase [Microbacteriaceae bacterium]
MADVGPFTILVVCTGNICRSPAAAELLRRKLPPEQGFDVQSAGTRAIAGAPVAAPMAALLAQEGIAVTGFAARQLTPGLLQGASLVLTMTRAHRATAAAMHPPAVTRAFTLREFAAILTHPDGFTATAGSSLVERAAAATRLASTHRTRLKPGRSAEEDDVIDPFGQTGAIYQASFDQLRPAVETILKVLGA